MSLGSPQSLGARVITKIYFVTSDARVVARRRQATSPVPAKANETLKLSLALLSNKWYWRELAVGIGVISPRLDSLA